MLFVDRIVLFVFHFLEIELRIQLPHNVKLRELKSFMQVQNLS